MKRLIYPLIFLAVLGGFVWAGNAMLARWQTRKLTAGDVPTFVVKPERFERVATASGYLKAVDSKPITAPRGARRPRVIAWMVPDGSRVKTGDVLLRFDDTDERLRVTTSAADKQKADRALEKERSSAASKLTERDLTAGVTKEELVRTKELGVKDQRFFPRNEVIESQLDESLYTERLAHAAEAKELEQRVSARQLEVLGVDKKKAQDQAEDAKRSLDMLEIRAAQPGLFVVEKFEDRMIRQGDRVWPGMRVAEVSTSDRMDAEVYVLEADAGGLEAGKPAEVVIESQPGKVWKAKVSSVEPFPKPLHPDVPTQYFTARVTIEGDPPGLKPGQSVRVRIFLEERNDALVVPRQAVFERKGQTIVFKQTGGGNFEQVPVTLGPGTVGRLVVDAGLARGDRVALRDPDNMPTTDEDKRKEGGGATNSGEGPVSGPPGRSGPPMGRRGRP